MLSPESVPATQPEPPEFLERMRSSFLSQGDSQKARPNSEINPPGPEDENLDARLADMVVECGVLAPKQKSPGSGDTELSLYEQRALHNFISLSLEVL